VSPVRTWAACMSAACSGICPSVMARRTAFLRGSVRVVTRFFCPVMPPSTLQRLQCSKDPFRGLINAEAVLAQQRARCHTLLLPRDAAQQPAIAQELFQVRFDTNRLLVCAAICFFYSVVRPASCGAWCLQSARACQSMSGSA